MRIQKKTMFAIFLVLLEVVAITEGSAYSCMDGERSLVDSRRNSYYCSQRYSRRIYGSERKVINWCNRYRGCTGYDYRRVGRYGHLCRQPQYPGYSRKCCGYKLCRKGLTSGNNNGRVDGRWSLWGAYTRCSKTCGIGIQARRRSCNNPAPRNGGSRCRGSSVQMRYCRYRYCARVNGGWSSWGGYSTCSRTCGFGTQRRRRFCNNPAPRNGGLRCRGFSVQDRYCRLKYCATTYTCMDGKHSMINSRTRSYYCSQRYGRRMRGSEINVINRCNNDRGCTGYDYRYVLFHLFGRRYAYGYGHLCRQPQYPGSSRKFSGYKLCKKSARPAPTPTTAKPTTQPTPAKPTTQPTPAKPTTQTTPGKTRELYRLVYHVQVSKNMGKKDSSTKKFTTV